MITPSYLTTAPQTVSPKLSLDFTTASLDGRITFTRTTSALAPATYTDSNGLIASASNDQARFEYDATTLTCKGLLIEESRTNLFLYSRFNIGWYGGAAPFTLTADAGVSPDGTSNATQITSASAMLVTQNITVASAQYTVSVWARTTSGTGTVRPTVNGVNFGGVLTVTTTWQRFTFTGNATAGAGIQVYYVFAAGTYLIWGAQIELGAFATSYIPTTVASLTRNADVAVMTSTNFTDWFNASNGTFRVDAISKASGSRPIISADDNSADNSIIVSTQTAVPTYVVTQGGTPQANVTAGTITANTDMFAYVNYASNYFGIARVSSRQIDTSGTIPTVDRLRIGANQAGAYFSNIIKSIKYWA